MDLVWLHETPFALWPPTCDPQWQARRAERQSYLGAGSPGPVLVPGGRQHCPLALGHSVVHQPQSLGLRPTQSTACEDELLRQGHPQARGSL